MYKYHSVVPVVGHQDAAYLLIDAPLPKKHKHKSSVHLRNVQKSV